MLEIFKLKVLFIYEIINNLIILNEIRRNVYTL